MNDSGGVEEFKLVSQGQNYISAKVVLEGDGEPGTYKAIVVNGKVTNIIVFDPGRGYTKVPEVRLIETSNKIYPYSKNIGTPNRLKFTIQAVSIIKMKLQYQNTHLLLFYYFLM